MRLPQHAQDLTQLPPRQRWLAGAAAVLLLLFFGYILFGAESTVAAMSVFHIGESAIRERDASTASGARLLYSCPRSLSHTSRRDIGRLPPSRSRPIHHARGQDGEVGAL